MGWPERFSTRTLTLTAGPFTSPGVSAVTVIAATEVSDTTAAVSKVTGSVSEALLVGTGAAVRGPTGAWLGGGVQVPVAEGAGAAGGSVVGTALPDPDTDGLAPDAGGVGPPEGSGAAGAAGEVQPANAKSRHVVVAARRRAIVP